MYFYEHKNGTIHRKPDRVVEMADGPFMYFESPFVKRWWHEKDETREDAIIEATRAEDP